MSTIIEIFRNLGTIVILLFQIGYVSIIDYVSTFDKPKPNEDDVAKSLGHMDESGKFITRSKLNNKVFDELSKLKKSDIIEKYRNLEDEVVHERPHYNNENI